MPLGTEAGLPFNESSEFKDCDSPTQRFNEAQTKAVNDSVMGGMLPRATENVALSLKRNFVG